MDRGAEEQSIYLRLLPTSGVKVCTVAPSFNRHGGVPYVARNVVAEFDARGVDCVVVTDDGREDGVRPVLSEDVEVHTVPRSDRLFPLDVFSFAARAVPTLAALDDEHGFDAVHMHGNFILSPILADRLGKIDAPLVETAHGTYLNELRSFGQYPRFDGRWKYRAGVYIDHLIQKYGTRFADHVHTVADRSKPELVEMGIDAEKIRVVPNGIDLAEFDGSSAVSDLRSRYGLEDATLAVSVGSTVPRKGVHTLVESVPLVHERRADAHVVHVGGHTHQGYTEYVESRIRDLGVEDAVTLTGRVPRSELLGWLRTADIAVSASYSEGSSISILEAGAAGCTVVATDVAGAPEVLGDHGIYVEPGDERSVAEGMLEGFERETGDQIRNRIERRFTWERCAGRLYEAFWDWTE